MRENSLAQYAFVVCGLCAASAVGAELGIRTYSPPKRFAHYLHLVGRVSAIIAGAAAIVFVISSIMKW